MPSIYIFYNNKNVSEYKTQKKIYGSIFELYYWKFDWKLFSEIEHRLIDDRSQLNINHRNTIYELYRKESYENETGTIRSKITCTII